MSRIHGFEVRLSLLTFALLLPACGAADDDTSDLARVLSDSPDDLERAETLAYLHLDERADTLLAGVDELWTERVVVDELGMSHTRLQQTVAGVPVFGGGAIVHTDALGAFDGMTDGLLRDLVVDTTPTLGEREAVALAVQNVGGWGSLSDEPRAELLALRHEGRDHLAYRVELRQMGHAREPSAPVVFVDAHGGEEIWRHEGLEHYALSTANRVTYDMNNGTDFGAAVVGDSSDATLLQTHDSVKHTLAVLSKKLYRSSYDGAGAVVHTYGHYGNAYVNAFWDSGASRLVIGDGGGQFGHFGVLDIVAHELGHAVTDHESNFTYYGEPGALDESSADIFAAFVSHHVQGDGGWVFDIGEDCWLPLDPSVALRYMSRPSDDGSSRDHYSTRYQGAADNGGVHFNSGIANHFFYLLSHGGQHHDPALRSGLVIDGIGIEDAHAIWYRALTVYMLPGTGFTKARLATEKAADDLFDASVVEQVEEAWYEVGVGGPP
ncbi:M4 family metallopeptidase [Paraliomyxa miuraensis]|uniref:M4 family metallopeptidase n=1 Tax=Paraliomyxa miuraensis TaxID=376150 RepID=UPI00224DAC86|nr:M4 family metallopeptidase [Paraliomyxa miuraensis]MCX4246633.1 M4 family metallopeptidase [Paraliomyxa miuraensis]